VNTHGHGGSSRGRRSAAAREWDRARSGPLVAVCGVGEGFDAGQPRVRDGRALRPERPPGIVDRGQGLCAVSGVGLELGQAAGLGGVSAARGAGRPLQCRLPTSWSGEQQPGRRLPVGGAGSGFLDDGPGSNSLVGQWVRRPGPGGAPTGQRTAGRVLAAPDVLGCGAWPSGAARRARWAFSARVQAVVVSR